MSKVAYKQWKSTAAGAPFVEDGNSPDASRRSLESLAQQALAMLYSQMTLGELGPRMVTGVSDGLLPKTHDILAQCIELSTGRNNVGDVVREKLDEYTEALRTGFFRRKEIERLMEEFKKNEARKVPLRPIEVIEEATKKPFTLGRDDTEPVQGIKETDELISTMVQVQPFLRTERSQKRAKYTIELSDLLYGIFINYIQFRAANNEEKRDKAADFALRVFRDAGKLGQFIGQKAMAKTIDRKKLVEIERLFSSSVTSSEVQVGIKPLTSRDLENPGESIDEIERTRRSPDLQIGPTK